MFRCLVPVLSLSPSWLCSSSLLDLCMPHFPPRDKDWEHIKVRGLKTRGLSLLSLPAALGQGQLQAHTVHGSFPAWTLIFPIKRALFPLFPKPGKAGGERKKSSRSRKDQKPDQVCR